MGNTADRIMDRRTTIMIIVGAIAGFGIVVAVVIGWQLSRDHGSETREGVGQSAAEPATGPIGVQSSASNRISRTEVRTDTGTGSIARVASAPTSPPSGQISTASDAALQKVEELPEVKQAHDALVAAHKRAADVMGKAMKQFYGDITFDAFQKVQNLPEVVQARQAVAEAQREYSGAKSKAMGSGKPDM